MDLLFSFLNKNGFSDDGYQKLQLYQKLLHKWQKSINLVSESSLQLSEERHFLDSAQLLPLLPSQPIKLVDCGSGAGFPGLVLAILRPDCDIHLIESDQRKAAFLKTVSRETKTPVTIHAKRIEKVVIDKVDIMTARALSSLDQLFSYSQNFSPQFCLFLKGRKVKEEITAAQNNWMFHVKQIPSLTDQAAFILKITDLVKNT